MSIDAATLQAMLDRMGLNMKSEIHSAVDDLKHDMNIKLENIEQSTKAIKEEITDLKNKDKIRREDIDTNQKNIEKNSNKIKEIEKVDEETEKRIKNIEQKQYKHNAEYHRLIKLENDVKNLKEKMANKSYAEITKKNDVVNDDKNTQNDVEEINNPNAVINEVNNDKNTIQYAKKRIGLGPIRLVDVGYYAGGIKFNDIHEANKVEHDSARKEAIKEVIQDSFKIMDTDLEITDTKFSNNANSDLIFFNTSESVIKRMFFRIKSAREHVPTIRLQTYFPQLLWERKSFLETKAKEERAKNPRLRTSIRLGNNDLEVYVKEVGEAFYTKMPINHWGIPPPIGYRQPTTLSPPKPRHADGHTWIGQSHNQKKRPQEFSPTTENLSKTTKTSPTSPKSPKSPKSTSDMSSFKSSLAAELQSAAKLSALATSPSSKASALATSTCNPPPPSTPADASSAALSSASSVAQSHCDGYASGENGNSLNPSSGDPNTGNMEVVKSMVSKNSKISKKNKNGQ